MRHRDRTSRHDPKPFLATLVVCALAAASAAAGSSSSSLPTFSSTVEVVNLNVSVTDGRDHYVTGLGAADFKVFEDGVPQQLCLFTQEHLPISLAILIDSSLSMQPNLGAVKAAAMRLVRALRTEDEAEIIQFNHKFSVLQDFTNDQDVLGKAIASIRADGATGVYNALYFTLKDARFRGKPNELTRQAIVVLTDGEDTSSLVSDDQVLQIALKSNVTIFTINLQ